MLVASHAVRGAVRVPRPGRVGRGCSTAFGVPALAPVVAALRAGPTGCADGGADAADLAGRGAGRAGRGGARRRTSERSPDAAELARELAGRYPGDPGVLVALLLNHVRLAPGEAIWMPAGNLHAYLRGAGVEIMAASDNVLRGGLTPKHVDVRELLRVLRFEVLDRPGGAAGAGGTRGGDLAGAGADDFALHRVRLDGAVGTDDLDAAGTPDRALPGRRGRPSPTGPVRRCRPGAGGDRRRRTAGRSTLERRRRGVRGVGGAGGDPHAGGGHGRTSPGRSGVIRRTASRRKTDICGFA